MSSQPFLPLPPVPSLPSPVVRVSFDSMEDSALPPTFFTNFLLPGAGQRGSEARCADRAREARARSGDSR